MLAASKREINDLTQEIEDLFQFQDHTDVISNIQNLKRANVLLEAELAELTDRNNFIIEQKAKLEELIRKELDRIAQEKKQRANDIIIALKERLTDNKLQENLVQKCLDFLSKIPSSKLQGNQ